LVGTSQCTGQPNGSPAGFGQSPFLPDQQAGRAGQIRVPPPRGRERADEVTTKQRRRVIEGGLSGIVPVQSWEAPPKVPGSREGDEGTAPVPRRRPGRPEGRSSKTPRAPARSRSRTGGDRAWRLSGRPRSGAQRIGVPRLPCVPFQLRHQRRRSMARTSGARTPADHDVAVALEALDVVLLKKKSVLTVIPWVRLQRTAPHSRSSATARPTRPDYRGGITPGSRKAQ